MKMEVPPWSLLVALMLVLGVKESRSLCTTVDKTVNCNTISDVSGYIIRHLPGIRNVTRISIKYNPNLKISKRAFDYATKLEYLVIMRNKINRIYPDTFNNISVKYLNLGYNEISYIFPGAFVNLSNLEELRLNNNNLKEIPMGLLTNLPLLDLSLSGNNIPVIENKALENLPNLKKLKLDHNKLRSIFIHRILTYPGRLEILWLHNNSLTTVTNYMLQGLENLKLLNLGYNLISTVESNTFEQTPKLSYLILTNNHLTMIDGSIFPRTGMDYLEKLYLDNNKLMFLSSNFFVRLGSLRRITLVGNPWFCSCLTVVKLLLGENNIEEKCGEVYSSGARPICVMDQAEDLECRHVYNEDLRKKYEDYKNNYPLYKSTLPCFL